MTSNLKIKAPGDCRRHSGLRLRHHRPSEVEGRSWWTNWKKNIHLGLDLKGGSQLVLQVQLQDAFKAEADTVIQRLKDELNQGDIAFADMNRNDPHVAADADTIQIDVKGVPATQAGDFRQAGQR